MASPSRKSRREPWHAVSIVARAGACPAALAVAERRFLSSEAPLLPLPECPYPAQCNCTYKHFTDRRAGPRRGSETGVRSERPPRERRAGRGRRSSDAQ